MSLQPDFVMKADSGGLTAAEIAKAVAGRTMCFRMVEPVNQPEITTDTTGEGRQEPERPVVIGTCAGSVQPQNRVDVIAGN